MGVFKIVYFAQQKVHPCPGNLKTQMRICLPCPDHEEGGRAPTWELDGEARLADEEVAVELQRERVEGAVDVLGQCRAAPLLQQDGAVHRPVPHLQDVMGQLRVKHDEVQAARRAQPVRWLKGPSCPVRTPQHQTWVHTSPFHPHQTAPQCALPCLTVMDEPGSSQKWIHSCTSENRSTYFCLWWIQWDHGVLCWAVCLRMKPGLLRLSALFTIQSFLGHTNQRQVWYSFVLS